MQLECTKTKQRVTRHDTPKWLHNQEEKIATYDKTIYVHDIESKERGDRKGRDPNINQTIPKTKEKR